MSAHIVSLDIKSFPGADTQLCPLKNGFSMRTFIFLFTAFLAISCGSTIPGDSDMKSSKLLLKLLNSDSQAFKTVMQSPESYRLQILYTQIDRDKENNPTFTSHSFGVQSERYFYPASTVKLPAAALALEKLNRLNIPGLSKYTPLEIGIAYEGQETVKEDPSALNGKPSIANYIKKILLVSDNDAYNRLFEFIGQRQLTESMLAKGYNDSKIIRRLSVAASPEQNRITNPFKFYNGDSVIYDQPIVENPEQYVIDMLEVKQGIGYMKGGKLVNEPINFSNSNYYGLADQQAQLRALMFPEATPESQRFDLSEEDYRFLYKYMSMLPFESRNPTYSPRSNYYDSYVKYVMFGDNKEPLPDHIRIYNKVGQAYGYLIDNAYVADFKNNVEFLLSVVIQVNENKIYNDNNYEYDQIGLPFIAELGRVIYQHELKRERFVKPDLSRFAVHP